LIEANHISFKDGASIFANTSGKGNGGMMTFRAKQIRLTGFNSNGFGSHIEVAVIEDSNGGHAGNILIETQDLLLTDGAQIFTPTFGLGNAGNVIISATGTMTIVGAGLDGWDSGIASVSNPKFIEDEDGSLIPTTGGLGGNIAIEAQKLVLKDGGQIAASSIAPEGLQSSYAGNISIKANSIEIRGVNPYGENEDGFGSGIYARSQGVDNNAGNAGEIFIEANSLTIKDGGMISSSTNNQAQSGNVDIRINGALRISGDSSKITLNEPAEAQLEYQAGFYDYTQTQSISGIYASSSSKVTGAGEAGQIHIHANTIHLANGGVINTSTQNAGGGNLVLHVSNRKIFNRLHLQTGQVTTSVQGGTGNGGNIYIGNDDEDEDNVAFSFVILDNGRIIAQADEGRGGNILIVADQFIQTPDSLVSASSRLGLDGNVKIDSPDENVNEGVFNLYTSPLDASKMLNKPCEAMSYEEYQNRTRLVFVPLAGSSPSPFDLQPSRLSSAKKLTQTAQSHSQTTGQTNNIPRQVALLTECQASQFQTETTQVFKENRVMPEQLF
jgi:large exoprotein involved in heme utilization and adhesion